MKEHPILFSGEMVRAILEGRKTQTRRVVTPQPSAKLYRYMSRNEWYEADGDEPKYHTLRKCPYGNICDRLWVRETWGNPGASVWYRADGEFDQDTRDLGYTCKWKPSIFMPRELSRINLEVTHICVERAQDITDDGAIEEGVNRANTSIPGYASTRFAKLWDSINAKRGFPWSSNPWVWVVSFKVVS